MLREANERRRAGYGTVSLVPVVPAPDNKFFKLYNVISELLNDQRWASEGKAAVGKKIPEGVTKMRRELDNGNERRSLNRIREFAVVRSQQENKERSKSTSDLYDVLLKVNQRSNFDF
jgi:hypothetical protein